MLWRFDVCIGKNYGNYFEFRKFVFRGCVYSFDKIK